MIDDYADAVAEAERLGLMSDGHAADRCQCPECGEVFSTVSNFDSHLQPADVRYADDYDGQWCRPPGGVGLVQSRDGPWHRPGSDVGWWVPEDRSHAASRSTFTGEQVGA